jgi:ABC-type transport system involved in multi-copper enzyme maturation permease subunit
MSQAIMTAPPGHYRFMHVVKAEVAKMLTVPSTAITLGLTVVVGLLVTVLVTHSAHAVYGGIGFDSTQEALTGLIVAALTGGVFGALLITGEYSSGTIRATLSATPKRPLLFTAKTCVTAVATVVFCEVLSFACFFLGQAILSARGLPTASLASPGAFRAVVMTGLFIALLALMAFGLGLITRNTAASIAAFAGVVFVLPLVVHAISESTVRYLPTMILTNSIMATVGQGPGGQGGPPPPLSPGVGLALMTLYTAIALVAGAVLFVRRDA